MALNNITVSDSYTPVATYNCLPTPSLSVQVQNAAIYYQLLLQFPAAGQYTRPGDSLTGGGGQATTEQFLLPGYWNFGANDFLGGQCVGIQLRNAMAGSPAQVTVT